MNLLNIKYIFLKNKTREKIQNKFLLYIYQYIFISYVFRKMFLIKWNKNWGLAASFEWFLLFTLLYPILKYFFYSKDGADNQFSNYFYLSFTYFFSLSIFVSFAILQRWRWFLNFYFNPIFFSLCSLFVLFVYTCFRRVTTNEVVYNS